MLLGRMSRLVWEETIFRINIDSYKNVFLTESMQIQNIKVTIFGYI